MKLRILTFHPCLSRVFIGIILASFSLSFYCGVITAKKQLDCVPMGDCPMCEAFQLAENEVDHQFGDQTFLKGFRRVLKDGEHDYYAFQVKALMDGKTTNLVVNVDLTGICGVVTIDYKAGYRFTGDYIF